ncbi:hypothetical protein LTR37_014050 [Vermiconidia calcicola]|uniref:Uncharacterized protein n=1 Tax=Vermiconidia calcicola TaxID=1690605 RepID=A0ACC3MUL3_9PEZI|nr:hypothetical protein LTR37_014050 [Vermiconidia calcicola]
MPLCAKTWGPCGLQSREVIKFEQHPDGSSPPYAVQAMVHWSKPEDRQIVNSEESKVIFDDVEKLSGVMPIFMVGRWVVTSKGVR